MRLRGSEVRGRYVFVCVYCSIHIASGTNYRIACVCVYEWVCVCVWVCVNEYVCAYVGRHKKEIPRRHNIKYETARRCVCVWNPILLERRLDGGGSGQTSETRGRGRLEFPATRVRVVFRTSTVVYTFSAPIYIYTYMRILYWCIRYGGGGGFQTFSRAYLTHEHTLSRPLFYPNNSLVVLVYNARTCTHAPATPSRPRPRVKTFVNTSATIARVCTATSLQLNYNNIYYCN